MRPSLCAQCFSESSPVLRMASPVTAAQAQAEAAVGARQTGLSWSSPEKTQMSFQCYRRTTPSASSSQQPVRPTSPLKQLQMLRRRWDLPGCPTRHHQRDAVHALAEAEKPVLRPLGTGAGVVDGVDVWQVVSVWVELFARYALPVHVEDIALVGGYLVC